MPSPLLAARILLLLGAGLPCALVHPGWGTAGWVGLIALWAGAARPWRLLPPSRTQRLGASAVALLAAWIPYRLAWMSQSSWELLAMGGGVLAVGVTALLPRLSTARWGGAAWLGAQALTVATLPLLFHYDPAAGARGLAAWAGLTCAGAVLLLGLQSDPLPPSPHQPACASARLPWTMLLLGLALPLGEGAAYVGAGLVSLAFLWEPPRLGLPPFEQRWAAVAALWLLGGFVSMALAGEGWLKPREIGRLGPLLLFAIAFLAVRRAGSKAARYAAMGFIASLLASCGVALWLYLFNPDLNSAWAWPLRALTSGQQTYVPGAADHLVAGGFYLHRLKLAHVLVLGLGLVLGLWQSGVARDRTGWLVAVAVIFTAVLALTFTRAALLAAALTAAAMLLLGLRRRRAWWLAAMLVLLGGGLLWEPVRERIATVFTSGAWLDRARLWALALQVVEEHPWGTGWGNFPELVRPLYPAGGVFPPHHYAHHAVWTALANGGPWGAIGASVLWGSLVTRLLPASRATAHPASRAAAIAALFALLAFAFIGLGHDVLYHKPVAQTFAVLLGVSLALQSTE